MPIRSVLLTIPSLLIFTSLVLKYPQSDDLVTGFICISNPLLMDALERNRPPVVKQYDDHAGAPKPVPPKVEVYRPASVHESRPLPKQPAEQRPVEQQRPAPQNRYMPPATEQRKMQNVPGNNPQYQYPPLSGKQEGN